MLSLIYSTWLRHEGEAAVREVSLLAILQGLFKIFVQKLTC
jgi:hypothetical protein